MKTADANAIAQTLTAGHPAGEVYRAEPYEHDGERHFRIERHLGGRAWQYVSDADRIEQRGSHFYDADSGMELR